MTRGFRAFAPSSLRVLAVAFISLAALARPPILAATAAGVGLVFFVWSLLPGRSGDGKHAFRWAGLCVIVILLVRLIGPVGTLTESGGGARPVWIGLLVGASALAVVQGHGRAARRLSLLLAMSAVVVVTAAMTVQEWRSERGLDVYWMHRAAGEAVVSGENPYTDAVQITNGSPFAPEGAVIEGYSYTPVVLGTYALAGARADPRIISGVAWLAFLAWVAWRAQKPDTGSDTAYAMFLLLSGLAVWPVIWFASWTEPLSIGLFLLTALLWRRKPVLSAVALGLAIASKQYFIFLAPLLLLHRDASKKMRLLVAFGTAALSILIGLAPDPSAFVTATVSNLSEIGFRPDTQSLSGLLAYLGSDFYLAPVTWMAVGLLLTTVVSIGATTVSDLIGRAGLAMGLVFYVGQAFPNYWFLVLALIALATVLEADPVLDAGVHDGDESLQPAAGTESRG